MSLALLRVLMVVMVWPCYSFGLRSLVLLRVFEFWDTIAGLVEYVFLVFDLYVCLRFVLRLGSLKVGCYSLVLTGLKVVF